MSNLDDTRIYIGGSLDGGLYASDGGCGCCSDTDEISPANVDYYIGKLQAQIDLLIKFKEEHK